MTRRGPVNVGVHRLKNSDRRNVRCRSMRMMPPAGSIVGLCSFVSSVRSARCRILRRHVLTAFAASSLRNVFAEVDTNPLERHPGCIPDRFANRRTATAFDDCSNLFAPLRDVRPSVLWSDRLTDGDDRYRWSAVLPILPFAFIRGWKSLCNANSLACLCTARYDRGWPDG